MTNNIKTGLANLLFVLALPALAYGTAQFVRCGFLCINRLMWMYYIIMGSALALALVNTMFYKKQKSVMALVMLVFWTLLFLVMLVYYIVLRCT